MDEKIDKKVSVEEISELQKDIYCYLKDYDWTMLDVGIKLIGFMDVHGQKGIKALIGFLNFAKNNIDRIIIIATLGHDLNQYNEKCMIPRTSSYINFYESK